MSIGTTVTFLVMLRNLDEARLLLIAIANSVDRKFDANLTSFVGILSVPDTFLVLRDFRITFTSLEVTCLDENKVLSDFKWVFTDTLSLDRTFYDRMIFVLFDNAMKYYSLVKLFIVTACLSLYHYLQY